MSSGSRFELRGSVEVLGRPLPAGLATLIGDRRAWSGPDRFSRNRPCPGGTERHLLPLVDGFFHFKGLSPGNYTLKISPLGLLDPLPLACGGLPLEISSYRLTIGDDGAAGFYGAGGERLAGGRELSLAWRPAPEKDAALFRGLVEFRGPAPADLKKDPILLSLQVIRPGALGPAYRFHWLDGALKRGRAAFSFEAPAGRFYDFRSWSGKWAVRPDLAGFDVGLELKPARAASMLFEAARGVLVSGKIGFPAALKFRPDFGADPAARNVCFVTFRRQDWRQHVAADAQGRYEARVFPDRYAVAASYERAGRMVSAWPSAGQLAWLDPGRGRTLNMRFGKWTDARLALGSAGPLGAGGAGIIAYRGGLRGPRGISLMDDCYSGFSLRVGRLGGWEHHDIAAPDGLLGREGAVPPPPGVAEARIAPGKYDLFAVQAEAAPPFYSLRVLTAAENVAFGGGPAARFAGPFYPAGRAGLRGSFCVGRFPGQGELRKARSMRELGALMLPQVDLYDESGAYRGTAFAVFSEAGYERAAAARKRAGRVGPLKVPLYFRIGGLPAGTYTARIFAYGRRPEAFRVKLAENKFTRLDAG